MDASEEAHTEHDLNAILIRDARTFWQDPTIAKRYDRERFCGLKGSVYQYLEERVIRRLLEAVAPGAQILDAASGTGRILSLLKASGYRGIGCDISQAMLSLARRMNNGPLCQADCIRLPFTHHAFEAVSCIGLFMHVNRETRRAVLTELTRVTNKFLLVQYGCIGSILNLRVWVDRERVGGAVYAVTEDEMREDLHTCGLQIVKCEWVQRHLSSSVVLLAMKK